MDIEFDGFGKMLIYPLSTIRLELCGVHHGLKRPLVKVRLQWFEG